jgi:rubrerythrin
METMHQPVTSEQWWVDTRDDEQELTRWLQNQYHGEITAAGRISEFATAFAEPGSRRDHVLRYIAGQEVDHASWVGELLVVRDIEPVSLVKKERYWEQTLANIGSFVTGAAVASHSERMRLERIRVIAEDTKAPQDIRRVFQKILPQERFHERAFRKLAGTEAMQATLEAHQRGRSLLGLFPEGA